MLKFTPTMDEPLNIFVEIRYGRETNLQKVLDQITIRIENNIGLKK